MCAGATGADTAIKNGNGIGDRNMEETMGFNMGVHNFRARIIDAINGNGLPASVTALVLENVLKDMEKEVFRVTQKEIEEYSKRKEAEESGKSDNTDCMDKQAVDNNPTGADEAEPVA